MVLEYLFLKKDKRIEVEEYKYSHEVKKQGKVTRIISPIVYFTEFNGTDHWAVKFEINGKAEESARHLSIINDYVTSHFDPIVLKNDSSEYYNKLLYPVVNEFERKLRRFLYTKSIFCDNERVTKAIEDLEGKTFEGIYKLLFVDHDFVKKLKEQIKNKELSRAEYINMISKIEETTSWDILVGDNTLGFVKENYLKIKDCRNDVMHAHNINYSQYLEARKLFNEANSILDLETNNLIQFPETKESSNKYVDTLLDRMSNAYNTLTAIDVVAPNLNKLLESLSNRLYSTYNVADIVEVVLEKIGSQPISSLDEDNKVEENE